MSVQTKHVLLELLKNTENGMNDFQTWMYQELHRGVITVTFTKKDGTERVMRCTLNGMLIPEAQHPTPTEELTESTQSRPARKPNPDVRTCYDVDGAAWKSFRWDSVKSVTYEDGAI